VLPSAWRTVEEPIIGPSIIGCVEDTSNIAPGVSAIGLCGVVLCGVLGAVGYSIAASLLLLPLMPVMCVIKADKVKLKDTSGHARLHE